MKLPDVAAPLDATALPLWPPLLATRGPGGKSDGHAHHAMHLVLALSGELTVRVGPRGRPQRCAGVLTSPDVPHALDASAAEVLLVFLDPESEVGEALRAACPEPVRLLSEGERDRLAANPDPLALMQAEGAEFTRALVQTLGGGEVPRRPVHPRVRKLLRLLRTQSAEDTSLEALAEQVGLSPSRLLHAFTESVGIPIRPYLAWLRIQRAAAAIVSGMPLGAAAHAAGFSDAAHMTRTFRRMFGMAPSALRPSRQPVRSRPPARRGLLLRAGGNTDA